MIKFENVSKIYPGNKVAVQDVDLSFERGEFIVFIGTSGSGKTTCMRMINRMLEPTKGRITIDGNDIAEMDAVKLRRRIGYVIQQIGLMPHMTIFENIVTVPKLLKWSKERQREIAERLIKRVDLPVDYLDRYPAELSGGQQQRIGVIRALAADQNIILMDEPFGALDPITRDSLQHLIKQLQKEMGKTIIFVTHDMDEALTLADRIAIMDQGRLIQYDTPEQILLNPANEFVANLLGEERMNQAKSHTQTVDEIMIRNPVSIQPYVPLKDALRIMYGKRVDSLFVTDEEGVIQGIVDVFDIDKMGRRMARVKSVMKECVYITKDTLIRDAVYSILQLGYRNLPVVDSHKRLVGLVTRAAIVESVYNSLWDKSDEGDKNIFEESLVQTTSEDGSPPPDYTPPESTASTDHGNEVGKTAVNAATKGVGKTAVNAAGKVATTETSKKATKEATKETSKKTTKEQTDPDHPSTEAGGDEA